MTQPILATALADPKGDLLRKLRELLASVQDRFAGIAVQATNNTAGSVLALLDRAGVRVGLADPDINAIGRHRRRALALALDHGGSGHIVYLDPDHLLRWTETDSAELDRVLAQITGWDCTVIGRGPVSMATVPRRLLETERIVNHIYALVTGRQWDLMMAARGLSRRAASAIVAGCLEDTIGNDVAWPLFCESQGFSLAYIEAGALTYRTNADYRQDLEDSQDNDPEAWAQRVAFAAQHVAAMKPYIKPGSAA